MKDPPTIAALVFGAALAACTNGPAPPATTSTAPQPASFDGRYEGSVQVSGVASGGTLSNCETDHRLTLQVVSGTFTYVQRHPNIENTAPSLTPEAMTATYTATISSDGSIRGDSGSNKGRLQGAVVEGHMDGRIDGVLCHYTFSADRL